LNLTDFLGGICFYFGGTITCGSEGAGISFLASLNVLNLTNK
jgi:hypothetical protein